MDLRKISTILNLFLELSEEDQKVLLNLLTSTSKPKEVQPPKVEDILEKIRKAAEKSILPVPTPGRIPLTAPTSYPPYIKKGDPFYPTITY